MKYEGGLLQLKEKGARLLLMTETEVPTSNEFSHTFERPTVAIGRCPQTTRGGSKIGSIFPTSFFPFRVEPLIVSKNNNKQKTGAPEAFVAASR